MAAVVAAVVVLVPLLITPHLLFYFDVTPKVAVALFGAAAGLVWFAVRPRRLSGAALWLAVLLGAQVLALVVSTAFSTDRPLSIGGANWRRFGLVPHGAVLVFTVVTAAWLAGSAARVRLVLRLIAASGSAAALYGVLQYFGWDPLLPAAAYHAGEGIWTIVRPPGTLGHADYFATCLLTVVFSGLALGLIEESRPWKILGISAAALGSFAVILSGTRAALLGLLAGGGLLLVCRRPRLAAKTAILAAALAAGLAAFYFGPPGRQLRSRAHWSAEEPLGGGRLLLWRDSLRMAAQRPFTGYGPDTFSSQFPRFESAALARTRPDFYYESPHNIVLDVAAGEGLPGAVALIGLCVLGFRSMRRSQHPQLAAALGAALAATLVSQQFTSFILPAALYFYLTVALLAALTSGETPPRMRRALVLAVSAPVAVVFVFFAVRLLVADRALALVEWHLNSGNLAEALPCYDRARAWQPAGGGADLWYSRRLALFAQKASSPALRLQAWQAALAAGVRATGTAEDRQNAYYSLASFYAVQNDFARTEACLRSAIAWAPNWFKPHWTLAQVLRAAGRLQEAESEAARAAELNAGKNTEVKLTLEEIRRAMRPR